MIFKIFKIQRMIKEGRENPSKLAQDEAKDFFTGIFIMPVMSTVLLLGLIFALGFTSFLGGPYGFAEFLFFLFIFCALCFFLILRKIYTLIKKVTKNTGDRPIKVESKIVE